MVSTSSVNVVVVAVVVVVVDDGDHVDTDVLLHYR